jgi:hypothetical protein
MLCHVSTSAVDTWRAVKIRTENLTEVPNGFLPLIQVPPMIQNKTEVLNLKSRKTQVPIGYLTLKKTGIIRIVYCKNDVNSRHFYKRSK